MVIGSASYYASDWGGYISMYLPGAMSIGGGGAAVYGASIIYDKTVYPVKEKAKEIFGKSCRWFTGYNVRTDKAIAAVVLAGSLPNSLNSTFWLGAVFISGSYLYYNKDTKWREEGAPPPAFNTSKRDQVPTLLA